MHDHEARLRAMMRPEPGGWPCLNDEDRAAIGWLFDEVFKARDALEATRRELHEAWHKGAEVKKAVENALVPLLKAVN